MVTEVIFYIKSPFTKQACSKLEFVPVRVAEISYFCLLVKNRSKTKLNISRKNVNGNIDLCNIHTFQVSQKCFTIDIQNIPKKTSGFVG